ncbi:MAG: fibrinogen-like YCDxxxxGGGW domain-containing protein [Ilumatobacter sp.]|uniref:fibrinogen-like YCDxxxxGGGW domain-containing protein n=1 Tax=Ilumatobacter sp. TaxID=1967498 RepID=UPI00391DB9B8
MHTRAGMSIIGLVVALGLAATITPSAARAQGEPEPATSTLDGSSADHAAASCWEIKQVHPDSVDGVYWLRTESLVRPEQFYCDMTTDGGGWLLIARGREGWTFRDYGQLTPQDLRTNVDGPAAFSPAALSTEMIDALLNGGDVRLVPDGVRLRRAMDVTGTTWQEIRWEPLDLTSWSWAVGAGHRLASFSVDGVVGTGSNTRDSNEQLPGEVGAGNGGQNGAGRWFTYPWSGHGGLAGFSFGGSVSGSGDAASYLWEFADENHAIPFTQVYLRPQISTPPLDLIAPTGTAEQTLSPFLSDHPEELAGGVLGVRKVEDSEPQVDAPVLAIATHGDTVYVGGKFDDVRDARTGELVDQNYLAAFDRETGVWYPDWRPTLDGTVWDLRVVDDKLIVAGQFSNVDGEPLTAGLAALDLDTGTLVPGWRASMELSGSTARPMARALDVADVDGVTWIYVGGNFTQIESTSATRNQGRLGRVRASDGFPDNQFLPDVGGVPYDVEANEGRVHVVGAFQGVNGNADQGVSTLDWTTGNVLAAYGPAEYTTPNVSRQYQQAVIAVDDEVWQGGSEHNVHVYTDSDYSILKRHVTSGRGGDTQAFARIGSTVFQASHGNSWIYEDARTWPQLDEFSRADDYKWVGAFDALDRTYETTWVPSLRSAFTEGVWELHADVDDCLWFGGDIVGGPFVGGQRQYLESFSKFCPRDTTAPSVPSDAAATVLSSGGVQVDWDPSNDDRPGFVGYEILRNDRVVSPLVYGTSYVDPNGSIADRYFVRAVDPSGNRSASSPSMTPGDNLAPTMPTSLAASVDGDGLVVLSWDPSFDDVGVDVYRVLRNGVELALVPGDETSIEIDDLAAGPHWLQVQAVDAADNASFRTPPVRIDIAGPDTQRPTQPGTPNATVDPATDVISFSWLASTDDTAVEGYVVRRNLVEVAAVDSSTLTVELDLGVGGHFLQVEAFDVAGNVSARTTPVFVEIDDGVDTQMPSTPTDLVATEAADGTIDVSWSASTDDVGVTSYEIQRNNVEVLVVDGATTSANLAGLGGGSHWIQVRAIDAAGNQSFKTSPVRVDVVGLDTTPPSPPGELDVTVEADGTLSVSWTASTDNVAVTEYRVLRNLVEVAVVDAATLTTSLDLGSGTHWIQLQAADAAGNLSFRTAPVMVTVLEQA